MCNIVIIVPVYNVENYLKSCIDSVLKQSLYNFKLILVNDGSTDSSEEICDEYKKRDKRIKVIHQENMGLSEARNTGLECSTEKYVMFLDSDDSLHKDTLSILMENITKTGADISVGDHVMVYEHEKTIDINQENNIKILENINAVEMIITENNTNMIVAWCKLYDRSLFENIRYPKGKYHEDEFVTYKLLYKAKKIVISDAKLYYYTQRTMSITGDKYSLKRLEKLEGLKEAINFFKKNKETKLVYKALYRYLLNIQIAYYRVKFELKDEKNVLIDLKKEYNKNYNQLKHSKNLSIIKRLNALFFYLTPNFYCYVVKVYMSITSFYKI